MSELPPGSGALGRSSGGSSSAGPARVSPVALLGGVFVLAFVLARLPGPLGAWVGALGTAAHEAGHAAVADVLTGRVASITVFRDGGGVTFSTASSSDWRTFLVSGAGYPSTLFASLAILTGILFARTARTVAIAGAVATLVALILWTPFNSQVQGVADGDQRFTWFVLALSAVVLVGIAWLPEKYDTARRVVLGVFATGLLVDAFSAGRDLVVIEGRFGQTATDADALAESAGFLSSTAWAWLLRASLFAIAGVWAWFVLRRLAGAGGRGVRPSDPSTPG